MAIWQELVDEHGFAGAYESIKCYLRKLRGVQVARSLRRAPELTHLCSPKMTQAGGR
jgi:hypothetical protein